MRTPLITIGTLLVLGLSACANSPVVGTTATGARVRGDVSTSPGQASQMPQSPNSLPPGDAVSAPISGGIGRVGTAR